MLKLLGGEHKGGPLLNNQLQGFRVGGDCYTHHAAGKRGRTHKQRQGDLPVEG